MNSNIKIKDDIRYMVGTMDAVPMWLMRDYKDTKHLRFILGENVSAALKATNRETAEEMLRAYKQDTGDKRDFAILKILVKYEIVDED